MLLLAAPALSTRTGGRRWTRRGEQTGRAPHHAASAPAAKGRGALGLLLYDALVAAEAPAYILILLPLVSVDPACPRAAAGMAERHEAAAFAAARPRPVRGECTWLARLRRSSPAVGPSRP